MLQWELHFTYISFKKQDKIQMIKQNIKVYYQQKLYVDNAVDLVTIDFQELINGKLKVLSRLKNNLPALPSPDGIRYSYTNNGIVTAWRK